MGAKWLLGVLLPWSEVDYFCSSLVGSCLSLAPALCLKITHSVSPHPSAGAWHNQTKLLLRVESSSRGPPINY